LLDVARDARNAEFPQHCNDVAVAGGELPDARRRVQHVGFGSEQALDRYPRCRVAVELSRGEGVGAGLVGAKSAWICATGIAARIDSRHDSTPPMP